MAKVIGDDTILRGLTAIAHLGLDGAITPRALYAMIYKGDLKIHKAAGKYTTTKRRIREQFDRMMDGV